MCVEFMVLYSFLEIHLDFEKNLTYSMNAHSHI